MTKHEEKIRVMEAWKQSGLGLQKYAEKVGISYGTLQYWRKRYRMQEKKRPEPASFVAMSIPTEEQSHTPTLSGIVIVLPSGVRIEVH
jgi:transposase-like protein